MTVTIEKAAEIGLCFGVKRAIDILEKAAREHNGVETLGAVVHNQQVLQRLAEIGVRVTSGVDDIQGDTVVISAHGVSPQVEEEIRARGINIIDTTCPFVHRAQVAARKLAESGFFVVIYGDADHPEVRGVLGWADEKGVATMDDSTIAQLDPPPHRLGILSQTTQIPEHFARFASKLADSPLTKNCELRVVDTICHETKRRQRVTLELANKVDLMLVIGSHTSANTNYLAQLCSNVAETHLIETAEDIQPSWLKGQPHIGITAGASTAEKTINEVVARLEALG